VNEYTLSGRQANFYGLLFGIPVVLLTVVPYILIWCDWGIGFPDSFLSIIFRNTTFVQLVMNAPLWLLLAPGALFVGIVLHELIHGVCMAAFAKNGWKSVSFGFNIKAFAPYTHCKEPLPPDAYRISLVMPGFLLGDVPTLISWFTGNILFLLFGFLFCWAAAGDVIILWMSRRITDGMLQDHPQKIGFVHVSAPENNPEIVNS